MIINKNMIDIFLSFHLDLETVKLSKEEFFNCLIRNNIFVILKNIIVQNKDEDKDFVVCSKFIFISKNLFGFLLIYAN